MAKSEKASAPKGRSGKPASKGGGGKVTSEEGSEKRIRQAVYDIRYRARREDIDLKAAFAQYMSNSNLSQAERTAVRAKLFGKAGGVSEKFVVGADDWASDNVANALYQVFVERDKSDELQLAYLQQLVEDDSNKKYKVRVTDNNGRQYVRFADRAKITELRQNPNIKSVEMTEHGEPYEGERRKGRMTARAKQGKKLDPVGKEDADVDNDGDVDKSDKYLLKRRKAIGAAIRKKADKKIKEAFLVDGTTTTEPKNPVKITGKGVDNYASGAVKVAPEAKETDPSVKSATRSGIYAHLSLGGNPLSESQKKLFEMMKAKEEDQDQLDDMATKDMSKGSCPPDEERKPDTRGMYAKINVIKNKLRSAGQRDPMVAMATMSPTKGQKLNMYGEENLQELKPAKVKTEGEKAAETERTPAKDDPAFDNMREKTKKRIEATKRPLPKPSPKTKRPGPKPNPKTKRPLPKPPIKTGKPRYNPYPEKDKGIRGTQATPENMAPGKP